MHSRQEIEDCIKHLLVTELEVSPETLANSDATTPLFGRGIGIDSMETLVLVSGIEKQFEIQIDDEDLTVDLFQNIATLADYVCRKLVQ